MQIDIELPDRQRSERLRKRLFRDVLYAFVGYCVPLSISAIWLYSGEARQLEKIASTDFLTGLLTRRAATEAIEKDRRKPESSSDQPQILALCDLDNFKMINDTHGHEVGDQVLQATGQRIASVLRQGDILARWGGEEFLVVLRSATLQNAEEALERVRRSVAATPVCTERASVTVTTSIGFAVLASDSNIEEVINEADICLYAAKAAGRNCVFSEAERLRWVSESPAS